MHAGFTINYQELNAFATLGTFLLILASVIAAAIGLHHASSWNQILAVILMERDLRDREMQRALRFVQVELPFKMRDEQFRAELDAIGVVDTRTHLEINACQWFDTVGTMIKNNLVEEEAFMDLFARLTVAYWDALSPVIAIMRRRRGDWQYANFEYLAMRSQRWLHEHPHGTFPGRTQRATVRDRWLAEDKVSRLPQFP